MDLFQQFKQQKILNAVGPGKIVVAVSGGADSMALLSLLVRLAPHKKWNVVVVHVQHHLRGKESKRDESFVRSWCKKWNIVFKRVWAPVRAYAKQQGKGIEESARILRYQAFYKVAHDVQASAIFLAHTANDQAETILMHFLRGAGVDGLAGMSPVHGPVNYCQGKNLLDLPQNEPPVPVVRPLLSFERHLILQYLEEQNLEFREDKSNQDLQYTRNWIRHQLLPLLQKVQPQFIQRMRDFGSLFQQERSFIQSQVESMKKKIFTSGPKNRKPIAVLGSGRLDLPLFFRYHIFLGYSFLHHLFPAFSYSEITQLYTRLLKEKAKGKLYFHLDHGKKGRARRVTKPLPELRLPISGTVFSPEWETKITTQFLKNLPRNFDPKIRRNNPNTAYFDVGKIPDLKTWKIRTWRMGDRFQPFGMKGSKKVQDFFVDEKVPRDVRHKIPIERMNKVESPPRPNGWLK
jgi:tRNA(Ile)-lysidine synthase